nr:uncharacterized protein LOC18590824 [Ipomoea batatas]
MESAAPTRGNSRKARLLPKRGQVKIRIFKKILKSVATVFSAAAGKLGRKAGGNGAAAGSGAGEPRVTPADRNS